MKYKALVFSMSLLIAFPSFAHHSFVAQYDPNKLVTLHGVISKVEWVNPHVYIYIDVKDDKAQVATWALEGFPPISLKRIGVPREMFKVGDEITATGFVARDGSKQAAGREFTFADGSKRMLGGDRQAEANRTQQ